MSESVNITSQSRFWSPECTKVAVITLGICLALVLTRDHSLEIKLYYKDVGLDVSVSQPSEPA